MITERRIRRIENGAAKALKKAYGYKIYVVIGNVDVDRDLDFTTISGRAGTQNANGDVKWQVEFAYDLVDCFNDNQLSALIAAQVMEKETDLPVEE